MPSEFRPSLSAIENITSSLLCHGCHITGTMLLSEDENNNNTPVEMKCTVTVNTNTVYELNKQYASISSLLYQLPPNQEM